MKHLATLEIKNYTDDMKVLERTHARALICKNGLYAMQKSAQGEYKLPGGKLENDELPEDALIREVKEETGLYVKPDSIQEIGEITEIRKDVFNKNTKYVCHSYYYRCEVTDKVGEATPSQNEIARGFQLAWVDIDTLIYKNEALHLPEERSRDTIFMHMVKDGRI